MCDYIAHSYIRMFDALYKNSDDNPTIGLILCSQKNEAIVKYSVLNDAKKNGQEVTYNTADVPFCGHPLPGRR